MAFRFTPGQIRQHRKGGPLERRLADSWQDWPDWVVTTDRFMQICQVHRDGRIVDHDGILSVNYRSDMADYYDAEEARIVADRAAFRMLSEERTQNRRLPLRGADTYEDPPEHGSGEDDDEEYET